MPPEVCHESGKSSCADGLIFHTESGFILVWQRYRNEAQHSRNNKAATNSPTARATTTTVCEAGWSVRHCISSFFVLSVCRILGSN